MHGVCVLSADLKCNQIPKGEHYFKALRPPVYDPTAEMVNIQHLRLIVRVSGRQAHTWVRDINIVIMSYRDQNRGTCCLGNHWSLIWIMELCPGSRWDLRVPGEFRIHIKCQLADSLSAWIKLGEITKCRFPNEKLSVHSLKDGQKQDRQTLHCRKCCLRNFVRQLFSEHFVHTINCLDLCLYTWQSAGR